MVSSIVPRSRTIIKQNENMIRDLQERRNAMQEEIKEVAERMNELTIEDGRLHTAIGMLEAANVALEKLVEDNEPIEVSVLGGEPPRPTAYVGGNPDTKVTFDAEAAESSRYAQADGFEESPPKVDSGLPKEPDDAFDYGPPPMTDDDCPF